MKFIFSHIIKLQDSSTNELELGAILEPDPIPYSFNTLGWKIIFVLLVFLGLYVMYKLWVKYRNNQYKRDAKTEILALLKNTELPIPVFISKVLFVLKQTALESYDRAEVAALQGDAWLLFLDKTAKVSGTNFMTYKNQIADALYRDAFDDSTNFDKNEFSQLTINWIKKHA